MSSNPYQQHVRSLAVNEWNQARRRAFWARLSSELGGKENALLDFNAIIKRLQLHQSAYRGVKSIPVSRIVGSVGRYQDFTRTFLPANRSMGQRWMSIAQIWLNPEGRGLPAIQVYQIGEWYFVRDGNHRVSVAKQIGVPDIDAEIWEYEGELPPTEPGTAPEAWLLECERQHFLKVTRIDTLRPNHELVLSEPGGYAFLLEMIAGYQEALYCIDETPIPYDQALDAWYDMLYEGVVQLIRETDVLRLFPQRTAADLFVWIMQHHEELDQCYGRRVQVGDAVHAFRTEQKPPFWKRARQWLGALWDYLRRRT